MPGPKDRFWCPKCRAFFCANCVRETGVCPNCGRRTTLDSKMNRLVHVFMVIMVVFWISGIVFIMYVASTDTTPSEFSSITNARPGKTVRLYGIIDAPNGTAFMLVNKNDDWMLESWKPFRIVDPKNSAENISVNLSSCNDFWHNTGTGKNDKTSSFSNGDGITVVGRIETGPSGERTIRAESVRAGREEPTDVMFFILLMVVSMFFFVGIFILLLFLKTRTQRNRHMKFLAARANILEHAKP